MTTITLPLAKQIAGLYVRLGELAPLSELYFMQRKDSGEWELHHFFDPDNESLVEALGLMLVKVLSERVKEKGL